MPIKIVREILDDLKEVNLVSETNSDHHKEDAYQPASDINKVTIRGIIEKLDHRGMDVMIAKETEELDELKRTIRVFNTALATSPENRLVKDI
jgi:membrane protein